ncbi:hypothetical protein BC829DRAFT_381423 [Chytridium lagenaria]|nr:hypothetical protein BC829DRAFT_381423 [Chytridium lagenaria]
MTLFIPQWDHGEISEDMTEFHLEPITILDPSPTTPLPMVPSSPWSIDASIGTAAGIARRWDTIMMKFRRTCLALRMLQEKYAVGVRVWHAAEEQARAFAAAAAASANEAEDLWKETTPPELPVWARHAMVLANIAARRTDDPKLGVGCVLVEDGRYVSVGWNGYPKRAQHLDYPQAGADDSVEDEELKYDYILHSEQNGLLWRNPTGSRIKGGWLICTKMPCGKEAFI